MAAARTGELAVLAALLVAYGNVVSLVLATATPAGTWWGLAPGSLLLVLVLFWARRVARLPWADLGLGSPRRAWRSAGLGLLLALVTAGPALLVLWFPPLVGGAVAYAPLRALSPEDVLWRALVWMPLDTAIPEEVAFRGVLLGALRRRLTVARAVAVSSAVFTAWHLVIVSRTLAATNL